MSRGPESGLSVPGCPDSRWTWRALLRSEDPEERQQRAKGCENVSRCSGETSDLRPGSASSGSGHIERC